MRLAVLSDIHANLEAFIEVLRDMERCGVDEVVCLGDNVGYGPNPEEVVRLVQDRAIPCVMGNHELGLVDPSTLYWFNPVARKSLLMTRALLSEETLRSFRTLPASMRVAGCLAVHGAPPASMTTYLFELHLFELAGIFSHLEERLCFVGHTHDLEIVSFDGGEVRTSPLRKGLHDLSGDRQYIVNVGSVGQPRDGNNNAKYAIWDDTRNTLEVRYVPYDIAMTVQKIMDLRLPEINARRLW